MERDMIAKRVCRRVCWYSFGGRPRKRWIDNVKECLKKRGSDIRQGRRMVQDRSEWWGFVRGNAWDVDATVVGYHSYMKPFKGEIPSVVKPTT